MKMVFTKCTWIGVALGDSWISPEDFVVSVENKTVQSII
jgi:hypothetical protein